MSKKGDGSASGATGSKKGRDAAKKKAGEKGAAKKNAPPKRGRESGGSKGTAIEEKFKNRGAKKSSVRNAKTGRFTDQRSVGNQSSKPEETKSDSNSQSPGTNSTGPRRK
jgi:hypothetical protein